MDARFDGLTDHEKRHALSKFLIARITGSNPPHPLAYSQESRWALTMASPDSAVENHTFAWKLNTAIDPDALRRAVLALLRRHRCLRSVFGDYHGRTVRFVQQEFVAPVTVYNRPDAPRSEIAAEIAREASRPFDLRSGPVLRVCLFQRAPAEQTLVLTAHHIVADFWSLGIAFRSLADIYARLLSSTPFDDASDEADYDAFVLWEARRALGAPGHRALQHWGRAFGDGLDFVALPTDRPWPAARAFRDAEFRFTIERDIVERLRALGQEHDCTLFAVMLALFNVLIHAYTRQTSIAVIVPVSVRSRLGFENLVGAVGNHLLLRSHLQATEPFSRFLAAVHQGVVDAMAHRDFPASLATRRVEVRGVPVGAVPFPLKFNMPKAHMIKGDIVATDDGGSRLSVALHAFTAELEIIDRRVTGNCELNIGCFETAGGLLGTLQYNIELFDETTITQMVARLNHLAEVVGRNASLSIGDLCLACEVFSR